MLCICCSVGRQGKKEAGQVLYYNCSVMHSCVSVCVSFVKLQEEKERLYVEGRSAPTITAINWTLITYVRVCIVCLLCAPELLMMRWFEQRTTKFKLETTTSRNLLRFILLYLYL